MSKANCQNRLQRISANSPQQQPIARGAPRTVRSGAQKPKYGLLITGAVIIVIGSQAVKLANENYEAIRDSSGAGSAAGLGLAAIAVFLIGIFVTVIEVFKRLAAPDRAAESQYSAAVAKPVRSASNRARVISALVGFAFGTTAFFLVYLAAAAQFVETEAAEHFAIVFVPIALLLLLVSLFSGLVGLFVRGYSLGRVPVYFLFGGGLAFAAVRFFRINPLEWPQFLSLLQ